MNLISLLGMLALLGIAWAMSYHRTKVNLRPIFWGLGLQFVLALTILRQDVWSFVGMTLLGLLVVAYIFSDRGEGEGAIVRPCSPRVGSSGSTLMHSGWSRKESSSSGMWTKRPKVASSRQ